MGVVTERLSAFFTIVKFQVVFKSEAPQWNLVWPCWTVKGKPPRIHGMTTLEVHFFLALSLSFSVCSPTKASYSVRQTLLSKLKWTDIAFHNTTQSKAECSFDQNHNLWVVSSNNISPADVSNVHANSSTLHIPQLHHSSIKE